ncbi:hypothetical protein [Cryobacterium melibiosiphilum]|uniref:hypothetical protein n=1 Tax=Cryobacterium melibiosiphilum TaxID=995039 RepID=UPI0011C23DB3|nr:hypothetical protein [Cryobacterium melibiosiphilum]
MENSKGTAPINRDDAQTQLDSLAGDRAWSGARAAAPWWLIVLHGVSVAGWTLSFGLGNWQAMGFVVSALAFVGLGLIRPWITRNHAEPWATSRRAGVPGIIQILIAAVIIAVGVIAYDRLGVEWALWPAAILAGSTTVFFGMRMERALSRDVAEGN